MLWFKPRGVWSRDKDPAWVLQRDMEPGSGSLVDSNQLSGDFQCGR